MWVRTPNWVQRLFPEFIWQLPGTDKDIYLTFDDGPTPGVTPRVLDFLFEYNAKATFFCSGMMAEKYPELIARIRTEGHAVGNHGYEHTSGLFCSTRQYIRNARRGAEITGSKLFRPPYGRIMPWQAKKMAKDDRIVQWSVMSMDFKKNLPADACYANVVEHAFPGSIVVFHDTLQAADRLFLVLPKVLAHFQQQGFTCKVIQSR